MKAVVIYQSKYGATAQYAQWIGNALNVPVVKTDDIYPGQLNEYKMLVIGSSVYIGKLFIKKWLKENKKEMYNKKIVLFVVSGTPEDQKNKLDSYINTSVPAEVINKCEIFFLPGKLKMKELSWVDKFKLKMGARLSKSKTTKKAMLTDYDQVKKENLDEHIATVKRNNLISV